MIYAEKGYYCKWNEETALLFSKRNCNLKAGENIALEIANAAIKRGIFSEEKYKQYGILTSKEIQKTYFEIVKRRTKVEIQKEYLLVSKEEIPQNVYINDKNVCKNVENVNRKEQSKVKERKESKNKRGQRNRSTYAFLKKCVKMMLKNKKKCFNKNTLICSGKSTLKKWQKKKLKRLGNSCL